MKRVLILCYYFPPCNGAPSWRPYSWSQYFNKSNLFPVVVTRNWDGTENTWEDYLKTNDSDIRHVKDDVCEVYYLPGKKYRINKILEKYKFLNLVFGKLYFLILALLGRFNTEVDAKNTFQNFLKSHLEVNSYDAIIISGPPSNIFELISLIKKKSNAKIVADIRDLWHNLMLTINYNPSFKQRIWNYLYSRQYKKWLSKVDLTTVIVDPYKFVLSKLTRCRIEVIYNGFESDLFLNTPKIKSSKFTISLVGNVYPEQDITIMLNGIKAFLSDKSSDEVQIRFIGANSITSVSNHIKAIIPSTFLYISGRVSKSEAIQETLSADILTFCGWSGVQGMISTKIFDYIASRNFILIAPSDNDALDQIVEECKCGVSVNSAIDFANICNQKYLYWKAHASMLDVGDISAINKYSRENQSEKMALLIKNLIDTQI